MIKKFLQAISLLPSDIQQKYKQFFIKEHIQKLTETIQNFINNGVPEEFPLPHLVIECTPSYQEAYSHFQFLEAKIPEDILIKKIANAVEFAPMAHLLVLLGQRITPGSIQDERAIPMPRKILLSLATKEFKNGITMVARALTKHIHRTQELYWGKMKGGVYDQNDYALELLRDILDNTTWWNVFEHYKHGIVYEARNEQGYGGRWGSDDFIGFLEPFTPEFPYIR